MSPDGRIKLVSELLDLPLLDAQGRYCGIVDDVEFSGGPGQALTLKALLVGPGAYRGRMPGWAMWFVAKIAGNRITRVPIAKVRSIQSVVQLDCAASELGLAESESAARRWIAHGGAI